MSVAGDGNHYPVKVEAVTAGGKPVFGWDQPREIPHIRVTHVIDTVSNKGAALSGWAFNLATEGVAILANEGRFASGGITQDDVKEALKSRNFSPYQQKALAATRGSGVHEVFENFLLTGQANLADIPTGMQGYAKEAIAWVISSKPKILATEATVASLRYGYAGTLDLLCELDGVPTIVDLKTSKRVYETHAIQLAAYRLALREVGVYVDDAAVLRVPPEGKYQFKTFGVEELDRHERTWKAMLDLYRQMKGEVA